jgi:hypothetical protein
MTDDNSSSSGGTDDQESVSSAADKSSLKSLLRDAGWKEAKAFIEPGCTHSFISQDDEESSERSSEARRKAEQRARDLANGWRQLNVRAPDDPDARELLVHIAEAIRSKTVRRNIRAVMADPALVMIGRRVRRLRGGAADQVRALLAL